MKTKNLFLSLGLIAAVFCAAGVYAADNNEAAGIYVPEAYGTIEEVFQGARKETVIHIQDAHTDSKAQENISAILDRLIDNYGVDSVWIEGASGVVDTSLFASFPAEKAKEALSKFYMDEGVVSGPEYFSINSRKMVHLFGAEEPKLYLDNVSAFRDSWADRQNVKDACDAMRNKINVLKDKVYPPDLKIIDQKKTAFEKGELAFAAYCEFLKGECEKNNIDIKRFGDFSRLFEMFYIEKGIDFAKLEPERADLIDRLAGKLDRESLTKLTQLSLLFRVGKVPPIEFYGSLSEMAKAAGIDVGGNLAEYLKYLGVSEKINRSAAGRDRESIESELYQKLCGTGPAKEVSALSDDFRVMEKFLTLKLSRNDFDYYLKHKDACSPDKVAGGIKDSCVREGLDADTGNAQEVMKPEVDKAERFYDIALKRDDELVRHLLEGMSAAGRDKAVLVSGGFHTEGIKSALRKKGISYVVILPKVGAKFDDARYASLLLNEDTPFLDFYKKKKKPDALPGSIGMAEIHERAEAVVATPTSFGENAKGENFKDEVLPVLPSIAEASGEMAHGQIIPGWSEALQKRITEALDIEKGVFKPNAEKFGELKLFPPLKLNENEIYIPVKIGERTVVLKFYKGVANRDVLPAANYVGTPYEVAGFTVQACDEAGFVDAIVKNSVLTNVKDAAVYMNTLTPEIKAKWINVSLEISKDYSGKFKQGFPPSKDPNIKKFAVVDLDLYETMAGLVAHLEELKKGDPNVGVVLVTRYLESGEVTGAAREYNKRLKDFLGLIEGVNFDFLINPVEGEDLYKRVVDVVRGKYAGVNEKEDIVIMASNPGKYGTLDAATNTINKNTPFVLMDKATPVYQSLLFGKLILNHNGNLDDLIAAILKVPSDYPDLMSLLASKGITDNAKVLDLIRNPRPLYVPDASTGNKIKEFLEFVKAV